MAIDITKERRFNNPVILVLATLAIIAPPLAAGTRAADTNEEETPRALQLPAVPGWFDGKPALYVSTDTSDRQTAITNHLNYVARLGAAANTDAVDDIYLFTNFTQSNVVPSSAVPEGPRNKNTSYSPLWQVSKVTWQDGTTPSVLKSEAEILSAQASGLVTIEKTNIIINCPMIQTPQGGLLPGASVIEQNQVTDQNQ